MKFERAQKKTAWSAEDKLRRKAIREIFREKPSYDQLVAGRECSGRPVPLGVYLERALQGTPKTP